MSGLIDTFILCNLDRHGKKVKPKVSVCFPESAGASLAKQVLDFCFVGSGERIRKRSSNESTEYTFVMTKESGQRVYGFCLRYTEISPFEHQDLPDLLIECACIISPYPYFSLFFHILNCVYSERLLRPRDSVPAIVRSVFALTIPAPGAVFEIEGQVLHRPKDNDRPLADIKFAPLVSRLAPDVFIQLLSALLCERRVIFISKDLNVLSNCTHAAVAILYPFTWQHVFIPVVPETLLNYASAPMPFIIGILANHVPKLDKLPTEGVIRVDLDAGTLACPYSDPIPPLTDPKEGKEGLKILGAGASAGAWALGTLSANLGSLEKSTGVSLGGVKKLVSSAHSKGMEAVEALDGGDAGARLLRDLKFIVGTNKNDSPIGMSESDLASILLSFYTSVFGDYNKFTTPGYMKSGSQMPAAFNKEAFAHSHRDGPIGTLMQTYIHSQMFEMFINARLNPGGTAKSKRDSESENAGSLFDQILVQLRGLELTGKNIKSVVQRVLSEQDHHKPILEAVEAVKYLTSDKKSKDDGGGNEDEFSTVMTEGDKRALEIVAGCTYDSVLAPTIIKVLCWRMRDSDVKLWKHAWSAMVVVLKLIEIGSERFLADMLNKEATNCMGIVLNWRNGRGRTAKNSGVNDQMFSLSRRISSVLNDPAKLRWLRGKSHSFDWGHWSTRNYKGIAQGKFIANKMATNNNIKIRVGVIPPFQLYHMSLDPSAKQLFPPSSNTSSISASAQIAPRKHLSSISSFSSRRDTDDTEKDKEEEEEEEEEEEKKKSKKKKKKSSKSEPADDFDDMARKLDSLQGNTNGSDDEGSEMRNSSPPKSNGSILNDMGTQLSDEEEGFGSIIPKEDTKKVKKVKKSTTGEKKKTKKATTTADSHESAFDALFATSTPLGAEETLETVSKPSSGSASSLLPIDLFDFTASPVTSTLPTSSPPPPVRSSNPLTPPPPSTTYDPFAAFNSPYSTTAQVMRPNPSSNQMTQGYYAPTMMSPMTSMHVGVGVGGGGVGAGGYPSAGYGASPMTGMYGGASGGGGAMYSVTSTYGGSSVLTPTKAPSGSSPMMIAPPARPNSGKPDPFANLMK